MVQKLFVVGAGGKVGRRLVGRLAQRGHEAIALHRQQEQAQFLVELGATPAMGDLYDASPESLATLMVGVDAIVFTAGAGGKGGQEMTNAIDGRGLEKCVDAARLAGVQRFILVSAFPEASRAEYVSDTFENYKAVKKLADVYLAHSELKWVILRPGTLTDTEGTGRVRLGLAIPYGSVSRDDVASVLVEIVEQPSIINVILELTEGDTPIWEAVSKTVG